MVNIDEIIEHSIGKDACLIKGRINIIGKLDFRYGPIALTCQMRQKLELWVQQNYKRKLYWGFYF